MTHEQSWSWLSGPYPAVARFMGIDLAPIALALLLTAQTALPVPDEATLNRALRIGYVLNGESMVRELALGSIDVSGLLFVVDSSLIETPKQKDQNRER